jgi:hypothetical protein
MRTTITLTVYKVKYDTVVDASHFILHSALRLFGLKEILEKKISSKIPSIQRALNFYVSQELRLLSAGLQSHWIQHWRLRLTSSCIGSFN